MRFCAWIFSINVALQPAMAFQSIFITFIESEGNRIRATLMIISRKSTPGIKNSFICLNNFRLLFSFEGVIKAHRLLLPSLKQFCRQTRRQNAVEKMFLASTTSYHVNADWTLFPTRFNKILRRQWSSINFGIREKRFRLFLADFDSSGFRPSHMLIRNANWFSALLLPHTLSRHAEICLSDFFLMGTFLRFLGGTSTMFEGFFVGKEKFEVGN